jgi:hypothetical protein
MGKSLMEALYVAVALTFSSTIIIVKLLSDKRELDSLHGRIAVGFLIVQDLAVVIAMMVMSALRGDGGEDALLTVAGSLGCASAPACGLYVLMRYVLPWVVPAMARSQELLLIFAIAWGTGLAALGEVGRLQQGGGRLPGRLLARLDALPRGDERAADRHPRLPAAVLLHRPRRQARLLDPRRRSLAGGGALSLFVLIGNPLIVMAIMGYMGYRKRTGFLCRAHGGADQRVLDRVRRHGHHARPCRTTARWD